jgi:hypothetical protein
MPAGTTQAVATVLAPTAWGSKDPTLGGYLGAAWSQEPNP